MRLLDPFAALGSAALAAIDSLPDISHGPRRRHAPRRFGDVTIRVHKHGVPKPMGAERSTVSDFTEQYQPARKGNGRPAASYRAERRNAGRKYRRLQLSVPA